MNIAEKNQNTAKAPESLYFMAGHFATDLCHGCMPVILAYMYQLGMLKSYSEVALLMMCNTILNAVVQPVAGTLADSKPRPYLLSAGIFLACFGVMFLGVACNQLMLYALVCINGVGAAVFHPIGGKMTNVFGGTKIGKNMSIFSVGGNAGFALGPFIFTGLYMVYGLKATLALCIPGLIMISIFSLRNRYYMIACQRNSNKAKVSKINGDEKENLKGFIILLMVLFLRSAGFFAFTSFISLYYMHRLGVAEEISTLINGLICLSGAAATYFGGTISDKVGFNRIVVTAALISVPFISLFTLTHNPYFATVLLVIFSMLFFAQMSPSVVIGQKLLCHHVGTATGFTIGLSMTFGGLTAPLMGKLGDLYGIEYTMYAVAVFIALAAFGTIFIPKVSNSALK